MHFLFAILICFETQENTLFKKVCVLSLISVVFVIQLLAAMFVQVKHMLTMYFTYKNCAGDNRIAKPGQLVVKCILFLNHFNLLLVRTAS